MHFFITIIQTPSHLRSLITGSLPEMRNLKLDRAEQNWPGLRCGQPRPGLRPSGPKAFLSFVCLKSGRIFHLLDGLPANKLKSRRVPGASFTPPINAEGGSILAPFYRWEEAFSLLSQQIFIELLRVNRQDKIQNTDLNCNFKQPLIRKCAPKYCLVQCIFIV